MAAPKKNHETLLLYGACVAARGYFPFERLRLHDRVVDVVCEHLAPARVGKDEKLELDLSTRTAVRPEMVELRIEGPIGTEVLGWAGRCACGAVHVVANPSFRGRPFSAAQAAW